MSGGKILNRLVSAEDPQSAVRALGNGKLRRAVYQAGTVKEPDEKGTLVLGICLLEAAERFCGRRVK